MSRFEPLADHSGISSGGDLTAWQTIRRGAEISPELTKGIGFTVVLAVLSTLGRVLVPFVVQRTTDEGILAPGGPDASRVLLWVALALSLIHISEPTRPY